MIFCANSYAIHDFKPKTTWGQFIRNCINRRFQKAGSDAFLDYRSNDQQKLKNSDVDPLLFNQNILLSGTEEDPVLKIADFGLSR